MTDTTFSTFQLPTADELPAPGTALHALFAFANRFDPTRWLREGLWRAGFDAKACATWNAHWARFKAGEPAHPSAIAILFTLNYDIVSGANLYRREQGEETFHRWLLGGLWATTARPRAAAKVYRWPENARAARTPDGRAEKAAA